MRAFQLTETAFRDMDAILAYLIDARGVDFAYRFRLDLFSTFLHITEFPGLGHKRPDLTSSPLVFFTFKPYLIVLDRREDPLIIHAVLHGSRDIRRILRARRLQ